MGNNNGKTALANPSHHGVNTKKISVPLSEDSPTNNEQIVIVTCNENDKLSEINLTEISHRDESPDTTVVSSITDAVVSIPSGEETSVDLVVHDWDGKKMYSDFVREALRQLGKDDSEILMLYESPSSSSRDSSFFNSGVFAYHDYPPFPSFYKQVLAPCRYSVMNGDIYSTYLQGSCPDGLVDHWKQSIPNFKAPSFTPDIEKYSQVYTYLPVESLEPESHIINPHIHYHLAGKDAINLMTQRSTRLLSNTRDERPCVAKVTHAMGSKGIFVIRNDEDEEEFNQFLVESGHPRYVVTEFVDIKRNVACHFFIHPNCDITWIGCNENKLLPSGEWSSDSSLVMDDQEYLKQIQMPFVRDVARYAHQVGFWGFCGCDVLFDGNNKGYLVDVNPRVTGSSPALMVARLLKDQHNSFDFGLFRRGATKNEYRGSSEKLLKEVKEYNEYNKGSSQIVLFSFYERNENSTVLNIGVYGQSMEKCEETLNYFSAPKIANQ